LPNHAHPEEDVKIFVSAITFLLLFMPMSHYLIYPYFNQYILNLSKSAVQ